MVKRAFKSGSEHFRRSNFTWLLVHKEGNYEYRSPDSVFIHAYNTFASREDALDYLSNNVAPVDRKEWTLYQEVASNGN